MKIAILSDSHDHTENLFKVIDIIQENNISEAIHLGDFIAPGTVRVFKGKGIHLTGILGNNDGEVLGLTKAFADIGGNLAGHFYETKFGKKKVACYHGTVEALTDSLIKSKDYQVVLYGHTHTVFNQIVDGVQVINPGTVHGSGYRASFVIYETDDHSFEFIDL